MKNEWVGAVYECIQCTGLMQSKYPGQVSRCACGLSYVDEGSVVCRYSGYVRKLDKEDYEESGYEYKEL